MSLAERCGAEEIFPGFPKASLWSQTFESHRLPINQ
jgi:hypothetical protein